MTAFAAAPADEISGFTRPLVGAIISQPYGCSPYAMEPADAHCSSGHFHSGIDLAAPQGTPVMAALPGSVHVVVSPAGYGLHILMDHGDGLSTLYGHLSRTVVIDGDRVAAGVLIGAVGSTGNSTGPHLHFEIRRDGVTEDPALDLALP